MNTSRLLEVINLLITVEKKRKIQEALEATSAALGSLVGSPSQPTYQSEFAQSLNALRAVMNEARATFQPAQIELLDEIGATPYFLDDLASDISSWISENVATPAVAQERLRALIDEREAYLTQIRQLQTSLSSIGIKVINLNPGEAEIGFLLPRDLFENDFSHLIKELDVIRKIMRTFSEVATGSAEPIEVRQISTSDPLFFFGLDPATIALIGGAITWALHTWKQVEEIRQLRAKTSEIESLKGSAIEKKFDEHIHLEVQKAVDHKTAELLKGVANNGGRKNEQETQIRWALESIISRVERGMKVEIRLLPPPKPKVAEGEEPPQSPPVYDDLSTISKQLVFPALEGEPLLALPPSDPVAGPSKATSPRRRKQPE